jgi:D-amino-acid dehydrogenase
MQADMAVLGAGMVGVSVAAHSQKRGEQVVLLDRRPPGEEASYENGGAGSIGQLEEVPAPA